MKQEEVFTACFTSLVAATKDLKGTVSGWEGSSLLTVEGSSPSWGRRHGDIVGCEAAGCSASASKEAE